MKEKDKDMMLEPVATGKTGKKRYPHYISFKKKDNAVRNIEIIITCAVAFLAGTGIYQVMQ